MAIRPRIGPHGDAVADRLVDGAGGHAVGIEVAVAGIHAAGDDDAAAAGQHGPQHGGVAGTVVGRAHQRLDHAAALHLVVVLADDPFLAAHVQRAEDPQQDVGIISAGPFRADLRGLRRRHVDGVADHRRAAVVEKLHRQVGHLLVVVFQQQPAGGHEAADRRSLDALRGAQGRKVVPFLRRHGQHHALLGLGDPDFRVGEALVLQRHAIQPDLGADLLAHLAHGAGKPAGAAVGHGVVEVAVAGGQEDVQEHFFGDGVADLHGAAGDGFALAGQLGRAEGGAMDAVAAGPSAHGHDEVARPRPLERLVGGDQADVAADRPAGCPGSGHRSRRPR